MLGERRQCSTLTFGALALLHSASAHLCGGGAQGHVPRGSLQDPPRSVLVPLLEATQLPLLGAGPPGPPLTHFTLCCQITREARGISHFSLLHLGEPSRPSPSGARAVCAFPQQFPGFLAPPFLPHHELRVLQKQFA